LLHRIIDAEGGPISMAEPLPDELRGLGHCGQFHLSRGGDLTGRLVLRLNGKLEENLSELWRLQEQSADFKVERDFRIGGKTVPMGATLVMIRFAPPGTPEHLAKNERPDEFLSKLEIAGDSGLYGVHGLLMLEFLRPDTPEDVHLELCEMIVSRDEVPGEGVGPQEEDATAPPPTLLAKSVSADLVLPLELRLAPQQSRLELQVFKEPMFGCFDKVLVLGRYGQQWLIRAAELDLRLGLTSEQDEEGEDGNRQLEAVKENHTGHHGFECRSVWRTRDGGVVVIYNSTIWGGRLDMEKPEDAYRVEVGELYGMPLVWRSDKEGTETVPGWFDGECIHWFEDQMPVEGMEVWGEEEEMSRKLPPSPWVRIRSASEEGGVPGPDNGLWKLVSTFYTECHGPLPRRHLDRVAEHQAGPGARELYVKSTKDSLFEKTQREVTVPFLSPADLNAVIGQYSNAVPDDLARENSFTTLASYVPPSPMERLARASTPSGMSRQGSRPVTPPRSTSSLSRLGRSISNTSDMHGPMSDILLTPPEEPPPKRSSSKPHSERSTARDLRCHSPINECGSSCSPKRVIALGE